MSEINSPIVVIAKHNNSLSPKGLMWLFLSIFAITMTVGFGVALVGAWLVLPFAGLELLAFACAFHHVFRHYEDFERITINDSDVIIDKRYAKHTERFTFQRYWAKVILHDESDGTCGLFIGSHGKEVEFGRGFMTDEQRLVIAKNLRQQLQK